MFDQILMWGFFTYFNIIYLAAFGKMSGLIAILLLIVFTSKAFQSPEWKMEIGKSD